MREGGDGIGAMAFYHPDGLLAAWAQASEFGGGDGRLATLPDVIDARLASPGGRGLPWSSYFTTLTSEFYGRSPGGVPMIAVLHGGGPLSTPAGAAEAYSFQYLDKTRERRGGRVPEKVFHEIVNGRHGPVHLVELAPLLSLYAYPLMQSLTPQQALDDPLVRARLDGHERVERYVAHHRALAAEARREEYANLERFGRGDADGVEGRIVEMLETADGRYSTGDFVGGRFVPRPADVEDGLAVGHLLSISQLVRSNQEHSRVAFLQCEVSPHGWHDGTRLVGVRPGRDAFPIHPGLRYDEVVSERRDLLWVPDHDPAGAEGPHVLVEVGDSLFAQYPKEGVSMDTFEPRWAAVSAEPLGEPVPFEVGTAGYHAFFRYGISDAMAHAPAGANAYALVGTPWLVEDGTKRQGHLARFYRVEVDRSRRLLRRSEVMEDMPLLLRACA